jgi:hypothetical protein
MAARIARIQLQTAIFPKLLGILIITVYTHFKAFLFVFYFYDFLHFPLSRITAQRRPSRKSIADIGRLLF